MELVNRNSDSSLESFFINPNKKQKKVEKRVFNVIPLEMLSRTVKELQEEEEGIWSS